MKKISELTEQEVLDAVANWPQPFLCEKCGSQVTGISAYQNNYMGFCQSHWAVRITNRPGFRDIQL